MSENTNFFSVNRKLIQSDMWLSEKFTRGQAWVDLIGLAQWKPSYIRVRGNKIDIDRGQLAYSQITLCARWHWSRNKTRAFLKQLEKEGKIEQQNTSVTTLITILNYDSYQIPVQQNEQQTIQQKDNRLNNRRDTYNKGNKENKVNKNTYAQDFEKFWNQYPSNDGKFNANKSWKKLSDKEKQIAISALPNHCKTKQWSVDKIIPHASTWLNQRRYEDQVDIPIGFVSNKKWHSMCESCGADNYKYTDGTIKCSSCKTIIKQ